MIKADAPSIASRYRKKPVVIEAVRLGWDTWDDVCAFAPVGEGDCRGVYVGEGGDWSDDASLVTGEACMGLVLPTLEGCMLAVEGDWIIRGVQGEFYPCKSDIFEATYERVVDDERTNPVSEMREGEAP